MDDFMNGPIRYALYDYSLFTPDEDEECEESIVEEPKETMAERFKFIENETVKGSCKIIKEEKANEV